MERGHHAVCGLQHMPQLLPPPPPSPLPPSIYLPADIP